ncbi:MAG TPA: rod shape-determining protein MreD [Rhizomicrobium sp.]|jgi:rod shape-determining protein MreD|nr:rod shape-determining protein MreD [Rhizomicrobium sp.]
MHDRIGLSFSGTIAAGLPFLCGVVGVIISNVPISFFGGFLPSPLLAFMPVYFWCLVRPDLMPAPAALALGALEDLLSPGPMGVWALAFVVAYALIDRERDAFAGLSGVGAIIGFSAAILVTEAVAYIVVAVTHDAFPPFASSMLQAATTILLYFPGLWLLNLIHHRLIGPLRSDF